MRPRIAASTLAVSLAFLVITSLPARARMAQPPLDPVDVAAAAAQALTDSGSKDAIPALRRMLNHPSIVVRYHAAYGLGRLGDKDSVKALKDSLWLKENDTPDNLLTKDRPNEDRAWEPTFAGYRPIVCWALRQLGDTSVDKRFIEILNDEKADIEKRMEAYKCLEQLGSAAAFDALCKTTETTDKADFGIGSNWPTVISNSLTPEQQVKLFQLAARNKNLSKELRDKYEYSANWLALYTKLNTTKSAEEVKKIFLEEKDPQSRLLAVPYFRHDDFAKVEDWMLAYITENYGKTKLPQFLPLIHAMLDVLADKGTPKALPFLETMLKDNESDPDLSLRIVIAINRYARRANPDRAYVDLGPYVDEIFKKSPEDKELIFTAYTLSRADLEKKLLERLRKPVVSQQIPTDYWARSAYVQTLLSWKSPGLADLAVHMLENSGEPPTYLPDQACMILRTLNAKEKLPDIKKYYERTHCDPNGMVAYTMFLLGDKDVPKMLLDEAQNFKPGTAPDFNAPLYRLLMYDDPDCQKFFFDLLAKSPVYLDQMLIEALRLPSYGSDRPVLNPIDFTVASPVIEKLLMNSGNKDRTRAAIITQLTRYAAKNADVLKLLVQFAAHTMDVSEQARKLIPQLGDKDETARKKTREELEKLGLDAAPAFQEGLDKYQDAEIQKALKELLDSYKSANTGF